MEICSEDGCARPRKQRGLCGACYKRCRIAGDLPTDYEPGGRGYGRGQPMPRKPCSFVGCDRLAEIPTSGLCRGHYGQQWRGVELSPLKGSQRDPKSWLLAHRTVDPKTGCWLWTGARDTSGYGYFRMYGTGYRCHRFAYELWVGPIEGDTIHHKCATRRCFNPEHLERATRRDNSLEMHERLAFRRRIHLLETQVAALNAELAALREIG